jgi:polysaccharide export outer membrane protein
MDKRLVSIVLVFFSIHALAQQTDWNDRLNQLSLFGDARSDYRLGPGDLIELQVFEIEDFEYTLRINSEGALRVPLVGTVEVAGLTASELEFRIQELLKKNMIRDPQVSVLVKEYRSQSIFVLGAVNTPGQFQITQPLKLVDAISMAGGLDLDRASESAFIQSRKPSRPGEAESLEQRIVEIDLRDLLEEGNLSLNVPVNAGDIINVPERVVELFYVIGEVNRPGAFEIPQNEELHLTQSLAWAGGPMKTANLGDGILVRYDGTQRTEIPINIEKILKGNQPDLSIQARDVLFVPGSTAKSIGYGLLGVIPGTISGAIIFGGARR